MDEMSRKPCYGQLDLPLDDHATCGKLLVSGWIVQSSGMDCTIELRVDGHAVPADIAFAPRPDLQNVLRSQDGADHEAVIGFSASIDSAHLASGAHVLSCVARKAQEETAIASRSFRVERCMLGGGPKSYMATRFLRGAGLEIGALHMPMAVPASCKVTYVDRYDVDGLRRHYPELAGANLVPVDVVDDGEKLTTVAAESQDFIIASHILEHCQDPIGTIQRYLEVIKPGGVLFLAIPDKRYLTFDANRPVTPLQHLYRDYEEGPEWSYLGHVREFAQHWNMTGEEHEAYIQKIISTNFSIHYHVWTQDDFIEALVDIRRRLALPFNIESVDFNIARGEVIAVLRRQSKSTHADNLRASRSDHLKMHAGSASSGLRFKLPNLMRLARRAGRLTRKADPIHN
jgi:predicted SAM-dependent methyltransferase